MSTTIEVIVKGIALWFQKDEFWNALLPFDKCHIVDFSFSKDDGPPSKRRSVAGKKGRIRIFRSAGGAEDKPTETPAFRSQVFDLTNDKFSDLKPYLTHSAVTKKTDWADKAVYLRLGSAQLSVFDYLQDLTDDRILVHGTTTVLQRLDSIAHWVKATITVPDKPPGIEVSIRINDEDVLTTPITAATGGKVQIVINNDCQKRTKANDMLMYYDIIDSDPAGEKFLIGDSKPVESNKGLEENLLGNIASGLSKLGDHKSVESDTDPEQNLLSHSSSDMSEKSLLGVLIFAKDEGRTGGASLLEGKPCMNVQVTNTKSDLPSFS